MINTGKTISGEGTRITLNGEYYAVVYPNNVITALDQIRTLEKGILVAEEKNATARDLATLILYYTNNI